MTVTAIPHSADGRDARPDGTGAWDAVAAARSAVDTAAGAALGDLDEDALTGTIQQVAALESQTQALRLRLAAEAERRDLAARDAATGTDAWLAKLTGDRREQLRGGLRLADLLQRRYPATLHALAAGDIRLEQARIIVDGLEPTADHVDEVDPDLRGQAEELLLGKATGVGTRTGTPVAAKQLRRAVRRAYVGLDHDVHLHHLHHSLQRAETRAITDTWLIMGDKGDGTTAGRFSIPERHGAWLRTVLESLTAPRRLARDRAGTTVTDDAAANIGYFDILGLGLCELIEHLPTDRLPRASTTLLVTMTLDDLRHDLRSEPNGGPAQTGCATTDAGVDLTAGEARRMACEAGLVPAVLGTDSVALDLGRTTRLFTDKQRQALALRHETCAIAGCDRPFAWTEIHHLAPWTTGGPTDLDNALPVCWHHHRAVEDPAFELRRHSPTEWTLHRRRRERPPPCRTSHLPSAS